MLTGISARPVNAVMDLDYTRAPDLVDVQLLWGVDPDLPKLHGFCVRAFDSAGSRPGR